MAERICCRCGQVLGRWDKVCTDCGAVQSSTGNESKAYLATVHSSVNKLQKPDVITDKRVMNDVRKSESAKPGLVWGIVGFFIGCIFPWIINVIILVAVGCSKNKQPAAWPSVRKGILLGTILVQIVVPLLFSIIGLLIDTYL